MGRTSLRPMAYVAPLMATVAAGAAAVPAAAQPAALPGVEALQGLEKGLWVLRERGGRGGPPVKRACLGDPAQLLLVRHSLGQCRLFVVGDTPERASVTAQCGGSGSGRSDLRVETPRLVQIDSQGVYMGAPYAMQLEGRRVGPCR